MFDWRRSNREGAAAVGPSDAELDQLDKQLERKATRMLAFDGDVQGATLLTDARNALQALRKRQDEVRR